MLQVIIKIEKFIITNLVKFKTTGIIRNIYGFVILNQIKFTYKNNKYHNNQLLINIFL